MRILISLLVLLVVCSACEKETDPNFLVEGGHIGKLDKTSLVRDLELIYAEDSLVRDTIQTIFGNGPGKVKVFEKGGRRLLTLTPNSDSIPTITNIQIHDPRFRTKTGINVNSTFGDIKENYQIRKIITSQKNVVVLVRNSDVYFTISKQELPSSLQYDASVNIEAVQIPDKAKIKYMMVGWD